MVTETTNTIADTRHVAQIRDGKKSFALECYQTIESIEKLKETWQAFEKISDMRFAYFQTYDWCIEYYKQFSSDMNNKHCPVPQVFVLWHQEKPVMLWPLMRIQSRTTLKLLTTATDPLSQYANLLFDGQHFNVDIGKQVFEKLLECCESDCVSLNHYLENSMIDQIVDNKGIKEQSNFESSILNNMHYKSWEAYSSTLSKSQRRDRKRRLNKLSAIGNITYEIHHAQTDEYKKLIAWSLSRKVQWLESTGRKAGILGQDETRNMLQSLNPFSDNTTEIKQGGCVHALKLDGTVIATEIGFLNTSHYYSYLGAIDPNWQELGPGKVQMEMAQKWALENGINCFDLLHDPSEYKSSWANETQTVISRNIPTTQKGYLYAMLWKTHIRPKLKSIYHFSGVKTRAKLSHFLGFIANK